jgi:hypothetical protein
MLQRLIDGHPLPKNIADVDLWTQTQFIIRGNQDSYRTRWIPSHLDDPIVKQQKMEKYKGLQVSDDDVKGNKEADTLASAGANTHLINAQWVFLEQEMQKITEVAQYMYVQIWDKFCNDQKHTTDGEQEVTEIMRQEDTWSHNKYVQVEDDPFELLQHQADMDDWEYACEEEAARSLGSHSGDVHVACELSDQSRPAHANDAGPEGDAARPNDQRANCDEGELGTLRQRYPQYGWTDIETMAHKQTSDVIEWPQILKLYNGASVTV